MTRLQFALSPLVPGWLLVVLVCCVLLPASYALFRRAPGTVGRIAASLIALVVLVNPQRIIRIGTPLPSIGVLAVDRSASMAIGNRARLATEAAERLAEQASHRTDLQLRRIEFSDTGTDGTKMFAAIDAALSDIPPDQRAGVIAITDGAVSDTPAKFPTRLEALLAGRGEQIDRRLRLTLAPSYGIVGQSVQIQFVVEDLGAAPGHTAHVNWSQDGREAGETDVTTGRVTSISIPINRGGPTTIALQAEALPHEASVLNNRVALTINGVRDRLRVLLISGQPHEGERTWRRLLKSDPSVDLVHFTILRTPGKEDATPLNQLALIAFPTRELFVDKIRQFDLIILDRFSETGILPTEYLQNIADYVRNGGALLVSAGPEIADQFSIVNSPIGAVLPAAPAANDPVVTGAFRPEVTPLGRRHPVTETLPGETQLGPPQWGEWYRRIAVDHAEGEVVMQAGAAGPPLLILNRVNDGRVALLLSDQIWLWARGHEGGGPQAELLRRVAHWLMKEPDLDENALTARIDAGRLAIERHAMTPAAPGQLIAITDPDGHQTTVAFSKSASGAEQATVPAITPGLWQIRFGGQAAYAAVQPADPVEWADLRATAKPLHSVARAIHWLDPAGAPRLIDLLPPRPPALRLAGERRTPLLPPGIALVMLLACLLWGWRREGR